MMFHDKVLDYFQVFHVERLTRKIFEDNVTILKREQDKNKLSITEAIFIEVEKPSMNIQNSNFDRALRGPTHQKWSYFAMQFDPWVGAPVREKN